MSYHPRHMDIYASTSSGAGAGGSNTSSTLRSNAQTPAQSQLQARIASKRAELENLRQLRDLSAHLTAQLEQLETKLGSLRDGAQAVALVLANWENVLQVIGMAAMKVPVPQSQSPPTAGAPDDPDGGNVDGGAGGDVIGNPKTSQERDLPVPLVRIPVPPKTEDGG
ncbi:hypothetical protein Z517_09543 [Fonsecaea pedrosoi CBS 271.37]|uniref:DASH complex subunit DAD2 n=1 Tax=Fonsecaea pedrosoi CBS 271.37 TaxID=1442368 RepID=A0A0D2ES82_9EURO|nr:uncharacterized protein Z517_09543 [Fonsecaea pedrosoi CBS 271.37]KIW77097.1 hypothetical protein Z517_09543 [Fonsecaea pedrosoi CBS 271.37]